MSRAEYIAVCNNCNKSLIINKQQLEQSYGVVICGFCNNKFYVPDKLIKGFYTPQQKKTVSLNSILNNSQVNQEPVIKTELDNVSIPNNHTKITNNTTTAVDNRNYSYDFDDVIQYNDKASSFYPAKTNTQRMATDFFENLEQKLHANNKQQEERPTKQVEGYFQAYKGTVVSIIFSNFFLLILSFLLIVTLIINVFFINFDYFFFRPEYKNLIKNINNMESVQIPTKYFFEFDYEVKNDFFLEDQRMISYKVVIKNRSTLVSVYPSIRFKIENEKGELESILDYDLTKVDTGSSRKVLLPNESKEFYISIINNYKSLSVYNFKLTII